MNNSLRLATLIALATLVSPDTRAGITSPEPAADVPSAEEPYTLPVRVSNKKGKPFKAVPIVVNVEGDAELYEVPSSGVIYIPGVLPDDVLNVFAGAALFHVEVGGYDSLNLVFKNARNLKGVYNRDGKINTGFGLVDAKDNTGAYSTLPIRNAENYSTLLDYLKGRIAGVEVVGNTVRIRGVKSFYGSNEPLVVVNGVNMDVNSANSLVRPGDIESITVDKTGSMYGVRGANGVIIITTRYGPR